jgi:hypothetical protein
MAARRPASKILWVAAALGASLILASALVSELRRDRKERECDSGDVVACFARCRKGAERACGELERRCSAGQQDACRAAQSAKDARSRRARW